VNPLAVEQLILNFLNEDLGLLGDLTSSALPRRRVKGNFIFKEEGLVCGLPFAEVTFRLLDPSVEFEAFVEEGTEVEPGTVVCSVYGEARAVLAAERTALNLLQRLSGVATNTSKFAKELEGSSVKLLDTRKTTPGLRLFEKYATKVGGAYNHRFGLYDAVMIKDNHLKVYGSLKEAVVQVSKVKPVTAAVEVEVENFPQLKEALSVVDLIDLIMLDNWPDEEVEEAVSLIKRESPSVKVELSGGVDLKRLKFIKNLPIDFVSTSKLVTGAKWLDVSLELE